MVAGVWLSRIDGCQSLKGFKGLTRVDSADGLGWPGVRTGGGGSLGQETRPTEKEPILVLSRRKVDKG